MTKHYLLFATFYFLLSSNSFAQFGNFKDIFEKATTLPETGNFTENEAGQAIKEALTKGITTGVEKVSIVDGFLKNDLIKIPFPENAKKVESTLRNLGLGFQIDKMVETMNHAAEDAAKQATPIFIAAIKQMTVTDAIGIINNKKQDAATVYLQNATTEQLVSAFKPHIKSALDKLNATKYWSDIMSQYNKIPFVQKVETDLPDFVTRKAIKGLFYMISEEEKKLRQNANSRTSDILKKVFGNIKI